MKLGIGSYCYTWAVGLEGARPDRPLNARDLLAKCSELNVRLVQFGPNLGLSSSEAEDLAVAAQQMGVGVEFGTAGLDRLVIQEWVELCQRTGVRFLRTVDVYEGPVRAAAELERRLREIVAVLEGNGVRLGLENALTPACDLAKVLDEIGSNLLGVTLDTLNSLAVPEGTHEVVRHLARHTLCVHVKDFRVRRLWHRMGFLVEGTPAGEGQLDIPWVLSAIRACGRDPNVILELWVPQQATLAETIALEEAWVRRSIAYLRPLIPD